ncbi:MAG: rRNA maturation RNase YbeY [Candidatus Omnitrophica bacterium]|nr:rRNA maturation RNase YbeY [Candidatus Omnitrophota bacterium]
MKITIKNLQKKIPIYPLRIKRTILKVLSSEKAKNSGEITVCFVNDKAIKKLNKKYLGRNNSTDVMAFDISIKPQSGCSLADIFISTDTAVRNARIFKTSPAKESELYAVHGILHLLGYDDRTIKQKQLMHKKEARYVNS